MSTASPATTGGSISAPLVALLAGGAGLSVASLYYNQPMLATLAQQFGATPAEIGRIPTFTQVGYAAGILLLAPLSDRFDRRRIIVAKAAGLCAALALAALAGSLAQLCALSVAIGLAATLAQDCVPAAATLAPDAQRGRIVGAVMTGLLLGILLSRVVSGFVAEAYGWRVMFGAAAVSIAGLGLAAARGLPSFAPTTGAAYPALLASLVTLWRRHAPLRRAAIAQGLLSAAFSAFWSTLAVMLSQPPFAFGSTVAGAFGLAGAAGALVAPIAGAAADRRGPESVTRLGSLLVVVAFVMMAAWPTSLVVLIAATVIFDLGVQAALIAHQSIVYGLEPAARSRLNGLLVGTMFVGMALGASLGSLLLTHAGWRGVCGFAIAAAGAALALRLFAPTRAPASRAARADP